MTRTYALRILVGMLLLLLAPDVWAQQGTEPVVASDLLEIRQLGSVNVSPNGRFVVYTVKSIVEDPDDRDGHTYRTHLHVITVDGSAPPRQLTHGERDASQPDWHPDSDRIAFVRPVDGTPQIFVLPLFGGEAHQLTDTEHGATRPRWSPDGRHVLFSASLSETEVREMTEAQPPWPDERPHRTPGDTALATPDPDGTLAAIRAWLGRQAGQDNPRVFHRLDLQGEHDLQPRLTFRHLFVIDTEADDAEPVPVTQGYFSFGDGIWMPNGQQILISGAPVSDRHPDRVRDRDFFLVDPDGQNRRLLLDLEGYALFNPRIDPDAKRLAFLARDLTEPGYAQTELGLFELDGRAAPELLTLEFDRSLGQPTWSADNWYLYFTAASDGGVPLYRLDVFDGKPAEPSADEDDEPQAADSLAADSIAVSRARFARADLQIRHPEIERLTDYDLGIRSYDLGSAALYAVVTEVRNPYELYQANMSFSQRRRLTEHNAPWLERKRLSLPESFTLERDTLEIDYWVMRPTFYEENRTYPLLLEIHGGPSAMWGPGEATMWHEFQFFASRGFGIVYGNPRGSGGYGRAFKKANYQDWGDGPAGDVLAMAREVVDEERWVDADRQVVTGGSYAGYLTAWIVGHDDRFQAAVAQRGVYDLPTFLGEGNAWRLVPYHFGGYPWHDEVPADTSTSGDPEERNEAAPPSRSVQEILQYNSPLTYVDQITTPLLIMHADNDLRTGVIQSEALYKSLKILERPVEYVRYPDAGHDLSRTGDPTQRMDRLLRIYEFFSRYVDAESSAPTSTSSAE